MAARRWVVTMATLASLSAVGWAVLDYPGSDRTEKLREEAHVRRLGDVLIRQGISLYQHKEYSAAITAWERYIRMAPPNADTVSIREMIGEAQDAQVGRASSPGPKLKPTKKAGDSGSTATSLLPRACCAPHGSLL